MLIFHPPSIAGNFYWGSRLNFWGNGSDTWCDFRVILEEPGVGLHKSLWVPFSSGRFYGCVLGAPVRSAVESPKGTFTSAARWVGCFHLFSSQTYSTAGSRLLFHHCSIFQNSVWTISWVAEGKIQMHNITDSPRNSARWLDFHFLYQLRKCMTAPGISLFRDVKSGRNYGTPNLNLSTLQNRYFHLKTGLSPVTWICLKCLFLKAP